MHKGTLFGGPSCHEQVWKGPSHLVLCRGRPQITLANIYNHLLQSDLKQRLRSQSNDLFLHYARLRALKL